MAVHSAKDLPLELADGLEISSALNLSLIHISDYINQNDLIHKTLRFSLKNKIPESEWVRFFNAMNEKYQ